MNNHILMIGPDCEGSSGGMASVIKSFRDSSILQGDWDIEIYSSCIDGSLLRRIAFTLRQFIKFVLSKKTAETCHIHIASYSSTWRKLLYGYIAEKKGMVVIYHVHGAEYQLFYDSLNSCAQKVLRRAFARAARIIVLSESWADFFSQLVPREKICVLYNSIDCCEYPFHLGAPANLSFVGRIGDRKGTFELIRVLGSLSRGNKFHCVFAGDGDIDRAVAAADAVGLSSCVEFTGWLSSNDIKKVLGESSIMILPSHNEGFPMSIVEAMATGNAIIATNVGGIPEAVCDDGSILLNPGDESALRDAIHTLLHNHKLVTRMALANRRYVENKLNSSSIHSDLSKIYREVRVS